MDHGLATDRKTRMKLKRSCSELSALIDRLRVAIKSRALEQSDRYALYTLIEKYTCRLGELERKRKLVEAEVRACNPLPEKERQETHKASTRSNLKKKPKVKHKKKRKVRYPKTPIQVEHAEKKRNFTRCLVQRAFARNSFQAEQRG